MFAIRNSKIVWPREQYELIQSEFGDGIDKFDNDLFEIAHRADVITIDADNRHFNEILAGELGIDLQDVEQAINEYVDAQLNWETFKEYKEIRRNAKLTFKQFVEIFQIVTD